MLLVNRLTQLAVNNAGGSDENGNSVLSWTNDSENNLKDTRQWRIEKDEVKGETSVQSSGRETQYWVLYNPDTKLLHFESNDMEQIDGHAYIYAANGECVMRFRVSQTADLSSLRKGIYILTWMEEDTKRTVKVTVR